MPNWFSGAGRFFKATPPQRAWQPVLGYVCGYVTLDWVTYIHASLPLEITPWNPPAALTLAFLMSHGVRGGPWVFLATLMGEILVHGIPKSWPTVFATSAGLALVYTVSAVLLRRIPQGDPIHYGLRDLAWFMTLAILSAASAAVVYVVPYTLAGLLELERFSSHLLNYWIGDFIGILVVIPLLMVLSVPARFPLRLNWELGLQGVSILLVLTFIFGFRVDNEFKFFYLLFLPMVWIATRRGLMGATLALALIQTGLILFPLWHGHQNTALVDFQMLMLGLAVTGLTLGTAITIRQQAEERLHHREAELQQALRLAAVGELTQTLAHELNQPLFALTNYARACQVMMEEPTQNNALLVETLGKLTREAMRASEVVKRLRDFFQSGEFQPEAVPVWELLQEALASVQRRANRHHIEILIRVPDELALLRVDRIQVAAVLNNLVNNAIDSLIANRTASRRILVSVAPESGHFVRFTVEDSGPGIPIDVERRLFKPFSSTKPEGLGLGLSICRTLVEAHDGRLWLESPHPVRFCFVLPSDNSQR
ncbi:histidine kinase [Gammaproteobacteria bacterium]